MRAVPPFAIVGAGFAGPGGTTWRGVGRHALHRDLDLEDSRQLAKSHPGTAARECPPVAAEDDVDPRAKKLMSPAARLAALAARSALREAGWSDQREEIGFFLGVGASGGSIDELEAMTKASVVDGALSMARLGTKGLNAVNPLFAFQLMNNFTLCHAAILEGIGGPNAAFFSRGAGGAIALSEAAWALEAGDCDRALAGAADSVLHPLTWAELRREGLAGNVNRPSECAAIFAVQRKAEKPLAVVERCCVVRMEGDVLRAAAEALGPVEGEAACLVIGGSEGGRLRSLGTRFPDAKVVDATKWLGESVGASSALALAAGLDLVTEMSDPARVVVVTHGYDGNVTALSLLGGGR